MPLKNLLSSEQGAFDLSLYDTLSVIGKGAYAKVLLVQRRDTQQLFALKVIKKQQSDPSKQNRHLQSERDALICLKNQPFIVRVHCASQNACRALFLLDYCPGGDLFELIRRRGPLKEAEARFVAAQLVIALETIHSRQIVYRDLKPENILFDADGFIRLADFGLSKFLAPGEKAHSICGTPEYLAPELLRREAYDQACDWWALGCLIFEMVVGNPPFFSEDKKDMFKKIKQEDPVFPGLMSLKLKELLRALLHKNPLTRMAKINSAQGIRKFEWFEGVSWTDLVQKKYTSPFKMSEARNGLVNFDPDVLSMSVLLPENVAPAIDQEIFKDFDWEAAP